MTCEAHGVKWNVGSNLFSAWRHEDPSVWQENEATLSRMREVKPRHRRLAIDELRMRREASRALRRGLEDALRDEPLPF